MPTKARKSKAKPKKKSKPKRRRQPPDFSQQSLAMVETIIGGRLKSPRK